MTGTFVVVAFSTIRPPATSSGLTLDYAPTDPVRRIVLEECVERDRGTEIDRQEPTTDYAGFQSSFRVMVSRSPRSTEDPSRTPIS